MKKPIITLLIILGIAGAVSYAIIWWRKKSALTNSATGTPTTGTTATTGTTGTKPASSTSTGYQLASINSYAWYKTALGHASFPLKQGSKGVEVVAVQEVLNYLSQGKNLTSLLTDGKWGSKTQERFKLFNPNTNEITENQFYLIYDPELLTK